jgi:hypothetical protein
MPPPLTEPTPEQLSTALMIISAMITPAVLILGSSSLIAATSTRLGRILERTRKLAEQVEALLQRQSESEAVQDKLDLLLDQLTKTTRRARLLQRAMTSLYLALGAFVATSMALGIDAAIGAEHKAVLVTLVLLGASILFYASILLVAESRIALAAVDRELKFLGRLANLTGSSTSQSKVQEKLEVT